METPNGKPVACYNIKASVLNAKPKDCSDPLKMFTAACGGIGK